MAWERAPVFYRDLAYIFVAALLCGLLARRLRQPLILGYIIGGILVGPLTPGPSVEDFRTIELLAEVGVILLMYSIGLEFSFDELLRVRWVAGVGTPVAMLLSIGSGILAGKLLRWPLQQGIAVGAIVSVASKGAFQIVVANAQQVKKVPGRKTDVKDAEWIADLLCHGLRCSFVPPKSIRELRDLTRYRRKLVESQAAERNRLLKLLESANIKLSSVATDVFGVSGRLMLKALVEGKASLAEMAELAKGKLRNKIPQLQLALEGKLEEHHRFLLQLQQDRLDAAARDLATLEQRIQQKLEPKYLHFPTGQNLRTDNRNPPITGSIRKDVFDNRNHVPLQLRVACVVHLYNLCTTKRPRPCSYEVVSALVALACVMHITAFVRLNCDH